MQRRSNVFLQYLHSGKLRVITNVVQKKKLLSSPLGDYLRNDRMIELNDWILRCNSACLIAICEEIFSRLLVTNDPDLHDSFPFLKLLKSKCS